MKPLDFFDGRSAVKETDVPALCRIARVTGRSAEEIRHLLETADDATLLPLLDPYLRTIDAPAAEVLATLRMLIDVQPFEAQDAGN